jgi:hypothetical protein
MGLDEKKMGGEKKKGDMSRQRLDETHFNNAHTGGTIFVLQRAFAGAP